MTCRECGDLMLEVARDRAAPFVARMVATHVAGCVDCARRLERERSLTAGLRALAAADAVPASADLEGRMAAAFAALQTERALPGAPAPRRGWAPVAAGLILAAGLTAWWTSDSAPVLPQSTGQRTAATLPAPPAPQLPGAGPSASDATGATRGAGAARRAATGPTAARTRRSTAAGRPASSPPPVQPAGFTAIPSAAGLPDFESGEIVRLDMPVTSLPNYGVEMPADAPSSSIQADLLVGQDGRPRAIRLVTASTEDSRPRR